MKEQIIKIIDEYCDFSMYSAEVGIRNAIADRIVDVIELEVEKRIAERMPTEQDKNKAAREFTNNDDMFYEEEIFKSGWDGFRSRMEGESK